MKKLTVKNKLVHVDVFIFHIDNNLTDLKHHFKIFTTCMLCDKICFSYNCLSK